MDSKIKSLGEALRSSRLIGGVLLTAICAIVGNAQMKIHHINVAQGDATLIELKTAAILVDADGSRTNAVKAHLFDYLDKFFEHAYLHVKHLGFPIH